MDTHETGGHRFARTGIIEQYREFVGNLRGTAMHMRLSILLPRTVTVYDAKKSVEMALIIVFQLSPLPSAVPKAA